MVISGVVKAVLSIQNVSPEINCAMGTLTAREAQTNRTAQVSLLTYLSVKKSQNQSGRNLSIFMFSFTTAAVLSFSEDGYTVREDAESVTVCVGATFPEFPLFSLDPVFNVTLITRDMTACKSCTQYRTIFTASL